MHLHFSSQDSTPSTLKSLKQHFKLLHSLVFQMLQNESFVRMILLLFMQNRLTISTSQTWRLADCHGLLIILPLLALQHLFKLLIYSLTGSLGPVSFYFIIWSDYLIILILITVYNMKCSILQNSVMTQNTKLCYPTFYSKLS